MNSAKETVPSPAPAISGRYQRPDYRLYVLALLTLAYVFNFVDRQIISILQEPIKQEFALSDTQLGVLNGFVFAIFYVGFGIPIARWADVGKRKNIIALAISLWSLMTALCGMAQSYLQLLAARIGVGIGEAGCSPPAHSMISDIFPQKFRATAMATYSLGINIGILVGLLLGGWLNELYGWRVALFAVAAPGILIALLIKFTVDEPTRLSIKQENAAQETVPFLQVVAHFWQQRTVRWLAIGAGLSSFVGYGLANWLPSFLVRLHGMGTGEIGSWLAMIAGVGGALGTFAGGYLADRLSEKNVRWALWVPMGILLACVPLLSLTLLLDAKLSALLVYIIPGSIMTGYIGPAIAVTHNLADSRMRAMGSALLFLVINIVGLGLGPVYVGLVSDWLGASMGAEGLRYAMLSAVVLGGVLAAFCFYRASCFYSRELGQMRLGD
ncbi:spinster family MFS transporter [Simiduia agarivorans]|uniref:Major facilitator superfamily transporter n=1 Tax=Simiduia agarivorans (strain DSM 21679 / JCM 13881 / BCRC 17597 / SA1) TaxID=1117647 RepID=K4KJ64_SIMAS|nr:MFS transporter [Simiduia agarivorans]AFU98225.1 major facilitator superfamily transporter [Simiduia agarivorans SA1 = DSM 21679]